MEHISKAIISAPTAHRMVGVFIQKGKKHKIECMVRSIALQGKKPQISEPSYASFNFDKATPSAKTPLTKLFQQFTLAATPFVSLKTRRRAKRASIKVGHLVRSRGSRLSLRALASTMRSSGKSNSFAKKLVSQLDALSVFSKNRSSAMREQRDDVHKQAFRSRPIHWSRKLFQKLSCVAQW